MTEKTTDSTGPVRQPRVVFVPDIQQCTAGIAGLVLHLDARAMPGPSQTFYEIGKTLRFPSYFGNNWDALIECLGDVGKWLQANSVLVVVDHADALVVAEHLPFLVDVLCLGSERAGDHYDADGIPVDRQVVKLCFVFNVSADLLKEIRVRIGRIGRRMELSPSGLAVW